MNIEFSRITPNLKLDGFESAQSANAAKSAENASESLFSDSLVVKESENFSLGDMGGVDMDEIEKELVRDDKLGKLFSSEFNFEPPEMPNFV
jgi:hypothetical protein